MNHITVAMSWWTDWWTEWWSLAHERFLTRFWTRNYRNLACVRCTDECLVKTCMIVDYCVSLDSKSLSYLVLDKHYTAFNLFLVLNPSYLMLEKSKCLTVILDSSQKHSQVLCIKSKYHIMQGFSQQSRHFWFFYPKSIQWKWNLFIPVLYHRRIWNTKLKKLLEN